MRVSGNNNSYKERCVWWKWKNREFHRLTLMITYKTLTLTLCRCKNIMVKGCRSRTFTTAAVIYADCVHVGTTFIKSVSIDKLVQCHLAAVCFQSPVVNQPMGPAPHWSLPSPSSPGGGQTLGACWLISLVYLPPSPPVVTSPFVSTPVLFFSFPCHHLSVPHSPPPHLHTHTHKPTLNSWLIKQCKTATVTFNEQIFAVCYLTFTSYTHI